METRQMSILKFNSDVPIRMQMINGEPWFVAKDVCDALGLSEVSNSCIRLREEEKGKSTIRTLGGDQSMTVVNESGLYGLIFQSRKPAARDFRYWLTSEVLPAIRKYGRYEMPGSRERMRLEAKYEKKERKAWLHEIDRHLTLTDDNMISRKCGCDVVHLANVLRGESRDTTVEIECMVRAVRNAKLRKLLDDGNFRRAVLDMMNGIKNDSIWEKF